jgi:hypothetical protein
MLHQEKSGNRAWKMKFFFAESKKNLSNALMVSPCWAVSMANKYRSVMTQWKNFSVKRPHGLDRGDQIRVARFFLTRYTNTRESIPNYHNITKWP